MRVICFDVEAQSAELFNQANKHDFDLMFTDSELNASTVYACENYDVIVLLSRNYKIDNVVFQALKRFGVSLIVTTPSSIQNLNVKAFASAQIHVAKVDLAVNPKRILNSLHAIFDFIGHQHHDRNDQTKLIFENQDFSKNQPIGFVGLDGFAQMLASQLNSLGFSNLLYYDEIDWSISYEYLKKVKFDELVKVSKIICFQPENYENHLILDDNFFNKLKNQPFLINNASLRYEQPVALQSAYKKRKIAGYVRNFISNSRHEAKIINTNKQVMPWVVNKSSLEFDSIESLRSTIEQVVEAIFEFGTSARTRLIIS